MAGDSGDALYSVVAWFGSRYRLHGTHRRRTPLGFAVRAFSLLGRTSLSVFCQRDYRTILAVPLTTILPKVANFVTSAEFVKASNLVTGLFGKELTKRAQLLPADSRSKRYFSGLLFAR
jgi:hypothetical protein